MLADDTTVTKHIWAIQQKRALFTSCTMAVDVINLKFHKMAYIQMVVPPSDHMYDCKSICSGNIFAAVLFPCK